MNSIGEIQFNAEQFLKITDIEKLSYLLQTDLYDLQQLAEKPAYNEYFVRKRSGGERLIEDPADKLQEVQDRLNDYLQSVYYLRRPTAAFGFQLGIGEHARNIKTNAENHLNRPYMIKVDFLDFFHQITENKVVEIFKSKPFEIVDDNLMKLLLGLVCYKGRLPMGSPCSPVLSNLVCLKLDAAFEAYAKANNLIYTRYADDLCFSFINTLEQSHLADIRKIVEPYNYIFNEKKVKIWGPADQKILTGIVLGHCLSLEPSYIKDIELEIAKYLHTKEMNFMYYRRNFDNIYKHEQKIEGHIQYVGFIYGHSHGTYTELNNKYLFAKNTTEFEAVSWMVFNNYANFNMKKKK